MLLTRRTLLAAIGITLVVPRSVAHAAVQGEVQIGDWERYYLGLDGGAHQRALGALGIEHRDGVRADEPCRLVSLQDVVHAAVDHGDHAAADLLRERLSLDTPSMLGRGLKLMFGQDGLEERYLDDPALQLRVIGHLPRHRSRSFALPESVRKAIRAAA